MSCHVQQSVLIRWCKEYGDIAQLVEHYAGSVRVSGSSPLISTKKVYSGYILYTLFRAHSLHFYDVSFPYRERDVSERTSGWLGGEMAGSHCERLTESAYLHH